MCLISHYRANIGRFDAVRGPIRSKKIKSKTVSISAVGGRTIPKGLLSILLVCLLFSALGNYRLDKGETGRNLYSNKCVCNQFINLCSDVSEMCNRPNHNLDWNKLMRSRNGNRGHSVTIAHWNGGSSQIGKSAKGIEKLEQIKQILGRNKIDILGISEANLIKDLDPCKYRIDGFDCVKSGGDTARTMTFIKSNLNYKVITNLMDDDCAENWLEIGSHKNKWTIAVYYREFKQLGKPNSGSLEEQSARLNSFLTKAESAASNGNCILIGDFNVNLDNDNTENPYLSEELKNNLLDTLPLAGFTQLVKENTRHRIGNKSTLIDHSWTNNVNKHLHTKNLESDSDHDIILTTLLLKGSISTREATRTRNYKNFDVKAYLADLMGQKWSLVYNYTDPTLIDNQITYLLMFVLEQYAPMTYKPKRKSYDGIKLSPECLDLIKTKNQLKFLAKSTGSISDWNNWKKAKNSATNKVRQEKAKINETKMFELTKDASGRELWQMVKLNAGWIKSLAPKSLVINGQIITSPKLMANAINEAFIGKISNICTNLGEPTEDPLRLLHLSMNKWEQKHTIKQFELEKITPARTREIINNLKSSHSECILGLSNHIIKISMEPLILPITHLINQSIETSIFPNKWKLSKVVPLYKGKGNEESPANYRPISLLNPMSKILEKEIQHQLCNHMNKYGLWNNDLNAYRPNHSTITALIDVMETWTTNIDNKQQNLTVFTDLSAAFDCVKHTVLNYKLKVYKTGPNTPTT